MPELTGNWLHATVLNGREIQYIDVEEINLPDGHGGHLKVLPAIPLTVSEFNVLKAHPKVRNLSNQNDRNETLGMLSVYQCLSKADPTLKESEFWSLPLGVLGQIAEKVTDVLGGSSKATGGGVLGELEDGAEQTME